MEVWRTEQGVSCTVGACGLCVDRECTARLDGVIPGDTECPGYLAHKMINPGALLRLRHSGYKLPQSWSTLPGVARLAGPVNASTSACAATSGG